jgi:hypothetical protein
VGKPLRGGRESTPRLVGRDALNGVRGAANSGKPALSGSWAFSALHPPRRAKPERRGSKPDMLEAKLISIVVEQAHRRARRSPALGGAARIEDLKAVLCFEQRQVAMTEDDGSGFGKALAEAL